MHPLLERVHHGAQPPLSAFVEAFGADIPALHQLRDTPQDPEWHAEGDVYVHTEMVLDHVYRRLGREAAHLGPDRRLALVLGAVFHDVAKPLVTHERKMDDGRVRIIAPRHAERGRSLIAYPSATWGLPWQVLRDVWALVGLHHDPKFLIIKDKPARRWRRLARLADMELLYELEQADMRGRVCSDQAEQIEHIEMFRLFAQEYGLWPRTPPYEAWRVHIDAALAKLPSNARLLAWADAVWDAEAGLIHTPEEAVARSWRWREEGFADVVVLCGPSGVGKSTWIADHLPDHEVVALDALREELTGDAADQSMNGQVRQLAKERLRVQLRAKGRVVWDATNLRADFRSAIIQLARDYRALTTLVVFHTPEAVFRQRNRDRGERVVRDAILDRQLKGLEWPAEDEAHRVIYVGPDGRPLHDHPYPLAPSA